MLTFGEWYPIQRVQLTGGQYPIQKKNKTKKNKKKNKFEPTSDYGPFLR